jgi:hypothetical protein
MFCLQCSEFTEDEKILIKYYNKIPTSFDENALYFLNSPIQLPSIKRYDRNFNIHSGIFYKELTILVLNTNGEHDYLDLNSVKCKDFLLTNISMTNFPVLRFKNQSEINTLKEMIFDDNYYVLSVFFDNNDKKNKQIVFKCQYEDKIYVAVTTDIGLKLFPIDYQLNEEMLHSAVSSIENIPYIHKKQLSNEEEELIFISGKLHKFGACHTVWLSEDKKKIPKEFQFYFYIMRINTKTKAISKIYLTTTDCPLTNNSKVIK